MWSARIRQLLALRESDDAQAPMFDDTLLLEPSDLEAITQLGETVDLFVDV